MCGGSAKARLRPPTANGERERFSAACMPSATVTRRFLSVRWGTGAAIATPSAVPPETTTTKPAFGTGTWW